jgi:hypothetical protein
MKLKKRVKIVFFLIAALVLTACAGVAQKKLSAEEIVSERASERWQLLIDERFESAYAYQTPEYRKVFDFKHFKKGFGGMRLWSKAEVINVKCDEKCVAIIKLHVIIPAGRWGNVINTTEVVEEQWVRSANLNEWFYLSTN